jgi:TonB family protein
MRFARVIPTRITGPEWIEPDPPEPDSAGNGSAGSMEVLAFHRAEELPPDLALDLRLHEILEDAIQTTAATGAMIALASGDKMVCRATSGEKTPSTGSFVNTHSGLAGVCVQTREMQRCDDTLTDPRVNTDACRALDVRSIVVLPVLEGKRLWGILELFSSSPGAFSAADVPDLLVLGRRVSHTVRDAVEGGSVTPSPDPLSALDKAHEDQAETEAREILKSGLHDPSAHRRDYRTGALTVVVIALAVLLGWMVGRVGWSMSFNRSGAHLPASPEEIPTTTQGTLLSAPVTAEKPADSVKAASLASVPPPAPRPAPKPRTEAKTEPKNEPNPEPKAESNAESKAEVGEPPGGLVVYEQGKVVFRMAPTPKSSASGSVSGSVPTAETEEGDSAGGTTALSSSATNNYLVKRVEPQYPEEAKQRRIEGPVVLNALVGTNGVVRELKVVSGDHLLAKSATDAVRQWRFQPHRLNNRLVEFETQITVNFALP